MTCQECIAFLWRYVEGELSPCERSVFDEHLARCSACVRYLDAYRRTVHLTRDARELPAVPEDLVRAILAARST